MYGWRARIVLLVSSINTTMEMQLSRAAHDSVRQSLTANPVAQVKYISRRVLRQNWQSFWQNIETEKTC